MANYRKKIGKSQFFVNSNLVTFGTYCETQQNSIVTNLVGEYTAADSFISLAKNLHESVSKI